MTGAEMVVVAPAAGELPTIAQGQVNCGWPVESTPRALKLPWKLTTVSMPATAGAKAFMLGARPSMISLALARMLVST